MNISTTLLPNFDPSAFPNRWRQQRTRPDTSVVIDVCRATSVMVQALASGATEVMTVRHVEQARRLADHWKNGSSSPLLCGERQCQPITGFDLGNSPRDYDAETVADRTIVLTTSNGTRAIEYAADVPRMYVASFANVSRTVDHLLYRSQHLHLVAAGTEGEVTLEDTLLAGLFIAHLKHRTTVKLDDGSKLAFNAWNVAFNNARLVNPPQVLAQLRDSLGGQNLIHRGFEDDLVDCAAVDSLPIVVVRRAREPATFVRETR